MAGSSLSKDNFLVFLDFENGENKAVMVNNYDWFGSISFIDFLRDIGKYFTVNYMMSKESVKNGLKQGFLILSLLTNHARVRLLRP